MAKYLYEVTFQDKDTGEEFTREIIASSEGKAIRGIKSESVPTQSLVNWNAKRGRLVEE